MEKYFIIDPNSEFYKAYQEEKEFRKKIQKVYDELAEKMNIQSKEYYPSLQQIRIIPTQTDKKIFKNSLFKNSRYNGLTEFRKNSKVNKVWIELCKKHGIEHFVYEPRLRHYFDKPFQISSLTANFQAFTFEGDLYYKYMLYCDFHTPNFCKEIKGSEYMLALEKYQEQLKEDNENDKI